MVTGKLLRNFSINSGFSATIRLLFETHNAENERVLLFLQCNGRFACQHWVLIKAFKIQFEI